MIEYFAGDERPYWEPTVEVSGVADDMSTGFTFSVKLSTSATTTPALTKSTGITGAAAGAIVVAWAAGELALTPGLYVAHLTVTRTSDSKEWTVEEQFKIKARL